MHTANKKILLWGSYTEGNFGDDLMAVMLTLSMRKHGWEPVVYGLDDRICGQFKIEKTLDLEEAIGSARACVIGGGAYLVTDDKLFAHHLTRFLTLVEQSRKPLVVISVGGDTGVAGTAHRGGPNRFESCDMLRGITVRLESDLGLFAENFAKVKHIPDIVFHTARFANAATGPREKLVLFNGSNNYKFRFFYSLLAWLAKTQGYRVAYLRTHLPGGKLHENELAPGGCECVLYENPLEFASAISLASLVVSHKLHVGVVALSFGIPFVSFAGKPKTKAFFQQTGMNRFLVDKRWPFGIFPLFLNIGKNIVRKFDLELKPKISDLVEASGQHFEFLGEKLSDLGGDA